MIHPPGTWVIPPIIHLNGTSAAQLKEALENTYNAVSVAAEKLRECAPNGRDYYLDPGRMLLAQDQHTHRQHALTNLMTELEQEMELIDAQVAK